MTSSNFKVNFVEPMVHIYQREFRRTMFELYFICNFRDLPTHVRDVVESDIRDAVIKLCIGELDNQKRLEKAQSVIKIGKFLSKYCQFLTQNGQFLGWNRIFQTNSPGIRRRDIIQQLGTNLWIALRRKKLSIPNICTFYRCGSKKKHFQKARAIKRNRQDRRHRNQGSTTTSSARALT